MPELGKYAAEVLSAYAASLVLLAVLIGWILRRGRRARAALKDAELIAKGNGDG